jgi:hypothetical protein
VKSQIGEWRSRRERECGIEVGLRVGGSTVYKGAPRGGHESDEPLLVELARLDADQVPGAVRLDPLRTERAPQTVHVKLERPKGRCRRIVVPERLDQAIARHHLVRTKQQRREQRTLHRRTQRNGLAVDRGADRSQDAKRGSHPSSRRYLEV